MAKKTYVPLVSQLEGWDAQVNEGFATLFDGPIPIAEYASTGALPAANLNDRALAFVNDATYGWVLYQSDGSSWTMVANPGGLVPMSVWLSLRLRRLTSPMSTTGLTTATSGSGANFYLAQSQYRSEMRNGTMRTLFVLDGGYTVGGTNGVMARTSTGYFHLFDGQILLMRTLVINSSGISIARVGVSGNGAAPGTLARPAYGVWVESDSATNGNANWWFCCANGSTVSKTDTGLALNSSAERLFVIEFEGTSSCKLWDLSVSTTTHNSQLTTNLPSGTTAQCGTFFAQLQSAANGTSGFLGFPDGDIGFLPSLTNGLHYPIPAF
jgi:hypothetical protein